VIVGGNSVGMGFLYGLDDGAYPLPQVVAFIVGCLIADALLVPLKPGPRRPLAAHLFSIATPIAIYGCYFTSLPRRTSGSRWAPPAPTRRSKPPMSR
jgi:hypothetical protein